MVARRTPDRLRRPVQQRLHHQRRRLRAEATLRRRARRRIRSPFLVTRRHEARLLVPHGFRLILEAEDDLEIAAEASDGEEAIAATQRLQPNVVLMDIQMPKLDGIAATRRIADDPYINSRVVILTTFEQDEYVFEALRAGASGFLLKNAPPEQLVEAVRTVAAGDALLSPAITRRVIEDYAQRTVARTTNSRLELLTDREREVLRLLATGKSNAELAHELFLGEGTIKTHVSHLFAKLGLRGRVQAVVFAYESGLVEPGNS
jgi:DNA-binding NarL/FixJ family response regulator